jgi:hypothetical protein
LRESDPDVDALLTELKQHFDRGGHQPGEKDVCAKPDRYSNASQCSADKLADAIAARIWAYVEKRMRESKTE